MTRFNHFLTLALMAFAGSGYAAAMEWSYDWPDSYSAATEKNNEYPGGFFNFGSYYFQDITSISRTLNGKLWTINFEPKTKLVYMSSTGQCVGSTGGFTHEFSLVSDGFDGKVNSIKVSCRTKAEGSTVQVKVGGNTYVCNGESSVNYYQSGTTPVEYEFVPGDAGASEGTVELLFDIPNAANNSYVKMLSVSTEDVATNVEAPAISPAGGTFDEPVEITLSANDGASIYYTLDGSNPRTSGTEYTAPFKIESTCTLKAVAKEGEAYSEAAEASYTIRVSPELKFVKEALTIELLEEDMALLDNPYNVSPITYKSSNLAVAYVDKYGVISTYGVGETEITASFVGNDKYFAQTLTLPVTIVAKEPLAGLTVTPAGGTFNEAVEVNVKVTDPRAVTLWYHIGDKPAETDDLGIIEDFEIHPATEMTLTLDKSCVLSVQAMGNNIWSEMQVLTFDIQLPLHADFEAGNSYETCYYNGFDSPDEANEWSTSQGSSWGLTAETGFNGLPPFSSINPDSQYSLFHRYMNTGDISVATSPDIVIPERGRVSFYAAFNPVWIYYGNLQLYICETAQGSAPLKIWDAFLASQDAATDDIKWNRYTVELAQYAGKEVYFAFTYSLTDGDNVLIDDFTVEAPKSDVSTVTVNVGDVLAFRDLSTGEPESYLWEFEGAVPATSTLPNPEVVYPEAGTYSVTLTVSKGDETDKLVRDSYVVARAVAPTAAIGIPEGVYYSPEAAIAVPVGVNLTFTDASKGMPTKFEWTLPGTNIETSNEQNVTVKYVMEGMFDVDLTVSNAAGKSETYLHGVKAGGETLVWNIPAEDNDKLGVVQLGWYGNYGGTNWLDMTAFAEKFDTPVYEATIGSVNVYFGAAEYVSADAPITVAIALPDENGMPGEVIAKSSLPVSRIVDASTTYNDPTEFVLDKEVTVNTAFFVTISGFPNDYSADGEDNIAMYALRRTDGKNTAYHYLPAEDGGNGGDWYAQEEDHTSFAIAPLLKFKEGPLEAVTNIETSSDAAAEYYNLQGVRVNNKNLAPGIYIMRKGDNVSKQFIK